MPEETERRFSRRRDTAANQDTPRRSRFPEADDDRDLVIGVGWKGHARTKAEAPSKWPKYYKVPDNGEALIYFLEDGPYASFLLHWCDWVPRGSKASYICLRKDCPLCGVNDAGERVRFNILDLSGDKPVHTTYECGISMADTLNRYDQDPKVGPLGGCYFAIGMTGPKNARRTQIRPVKERDLKEDWGMDPLTEAEVAEFDQKLWTADSIERSPREDMQKVADQITE